MANATQLPGGPLLNTVIPPGMTYSGGNWTFSGNVTVAGGFSGASNVQTPAIFIDGSAGSTSNVQWRVGGNPRWIVRRGSAAEAGSDAGSPFEIVAQTDAGATVDVPISLLRASAAQMTLGGSTKRTLETTGGRINYAVTVTDTTTLNATHHTVACDKGTAMTVNLPALASNQGRIYKIKNIGAGVVTVDANGSELIDGATTAALNQWQSVQIEAIASRWIITG